MEKLDKSGRYVNSELPAAVPSSVPSSRHELGTRIAAVVDLYESRKSAAFVAGVSTDQLARYMRGENEPPLSVAARLAASKGVSLEWMATGSGDMHQVHTSGDRYGDAVLCAAIEELQAWQLINDRMLPADKFAHAVLLICDLAGGDVSTIKQGSERLLKLVA